MALTLLSGRISRWLQLYVWYVDFAEFALKMEDVLYWWGGPTTPVRSRGLRAMEAVSFFLEATISTAYQC